jgi:rubrerythrin
MLSDIPKKLEKVSEEQRDNEILRAGMIAELDAVNLYEQLAAMSKDKDIKKVLLDIAREEKTHIAEFETLLLQRDAEQMQENEKGKQEVEELMSKE